MERISSRWRPKTGPEKAFSWPSSTRSRSAASATCTSCGRPSMRFASIAEQEEVDAMDFLALVRNKMKLLQMDEKLINRAVNEGFSGGEKKRNEIFQLAVLEPSLAILDETDSGLDIDALKIVAEGVNAMRSPDAGFPGDHSLSAPAQLHRPGFCPRAGGRADRADQATRAWRWSWRRRATWLEKEPVGVERRPALLCRSPLVAAQKAGMPVPALQIRN